MKPSEYKYPWSGVHLNCESEKIAYNIMKILGRTGDIFRDLSWEEYVTERYKDGAFKEVEAEKKYFDAVIGYCKSPDTAALYSREWLSKT